jgi:hemoglobin/transferrin/lactoferrin receptor protein
MHQQNNDRARLGAANLCCGVSRLALGAALLVLAAGCLPFDARAQSAPAGTTVLPQLRIEAATPRQARPRASRPVSPARARRAAPRPAAPAATAQPTATPLPADGLGRAPLARGATTTLGPAILSRTQPSNLREVFATTTAVSTGGTTNSSQKVFVNGLEETLLNVQVDGARQPQTSAFHHNSTLVIDPTLLKSVAVDAGVAPADAGPFALGGAMRYQTKTVGDLLAPGRMAGGFAGVSFDTNSATFTKYGSGYARKDGFEILGYLSQARGEAYRDGRGTKVRGTGQDALSGLAKFAYESREGHRFDLSGEYIEDEGTRPFRANFAGLTSGAAFSFNRQWRQAATFKYSMTAPSALYDPEVVVYYSNSRTYRPPVGAPAPGYFDVKLESFGLKAQNTFAVLGGKLTLGVDASRDDAKVDRLNGTGFALGETSTNLGAFIQHRAELLPGLRLSTGLRADHNQFENARGGEKNTSGLSPNIAAEYDLTRQFTVKAAYGYTFGGIPIYEPGLITATSPLYNRPLDAQSATKFRVALAFREAGFQAEIAGFQTRIIDPVCPNCSPRVNGPALTTKGIDAGASYRAGGALVGINYSYVTAEFSNGPLTPTSWYYGTPMGHTIKAHGHYEFASYGLTIGFLSRFALDYNRLENVAGPGGQPYGRFKGYGVHDIYAQWVPPQFTQLTLRAELRNVFDKYYVERGTALGGTVVPLGAQGRTGLLSARMTF